MMFNRMLAFAGKYQRPAAFFTSIVVATFTIYKAKVELFEYLTPKQSYGEQETARFDFYSKAPTNYFVEYLEIKIESRKDNIFQMNSLVSRGRQDVRMTWKDTATFKDIDGKLIPRTAPCFPEYPGDKIHTVDCEKIGLNGWFQHQWWREVMPRKADTSWEPWEYNQKIIPDGAHSIQICSNQTIRVYESFLGKVDKKQDICTDEYVLSDIKIKLGE